MQPAFTHGPTPPPLARPPAVQRRPAAEAAGAFYERLSRRSVEKHFDAFADVAWDAPEHAIDPRDPRFALGADDPLGGTDWYRSLPRDTQARLGLHKVAQQMRVGLEFENVLSRGLLELALALPHGAPEFRYAYHEVIEEGQHTLMFNEFVRRAALPTRGLPTFERVASRHVVRFGRTFPELFMLFVLGGEAPIDRVQRDELRSGTELHPLLERIMRIHVLEEARHLSFAKRYLVEHVPELGAVRRFQLRVRTPILLGVMAGEMMRVPSWLGAEYGASPELLRRAYRTEAYRDRIRIALEPVRRLAVDLDLVTGWSRPLWKKAGLWPRASDTSA